MPHYWLLMEEIRLVYPIIYKVLYIPGGSPDFWTINSMLLVWFPLNIGPPKMTPLQLRSHHYMATRDLGPRDKSL